MHTLSSQEIGVTGVIVGVTWRTTTCKWQGKENPWYKYIIN